MVFLDSRSLPTLLCLAAAIELSSSAYAQGTRPTVVRLTGSPIIRPEMLKGADGNNIDGPSLIRVPDWLPAPLGRYYLYFASHNGGQYIRLAFANNITGPYTVYDPGTLRIDQAPWCQHMIASPDVHVDDSRRQIRMYFHCADRSSGKMTSFVAGSENGSQFTPNPEPIAPGFLRMFEWHGYQYALAMPGEIFRSRDGLTGFTKGPTLFNENMRHSGLVRTDDGRLWVFYSNVGEAPPERILLSKVQLTDDWMRWKNEAPVVILEPETPYEGGDLPLSSSRRGGATHVRQLRDPAVYYEAGKWYLLYSVAGESGIAIAELTNWKP